MFANKKCVCILLPCFLITLFSFSHLWAQEGSKKTPSEQRMSENKQKPAPSLTIKGTKIEIVSDKKTSEKQKAESTQEQVSTKNQAQISVESPHYDAGEIWEGKKEIVHTFTIKNTGTAPLTIKKVDAG